jgi:hypothetical protein
MLIKMMALSFSYKDGAMKSADLQNDSQRENALKDTPTFYEVFSFSFAVCTAIIGPFFNLSEYLDFINKRNRY